MVFTWLCIKKGTFYEYDTISLYKRIDNSGIRPWHAYIRRANFGFDVTFNTIHNSHIQTLNKR